MCIQDSKQNNTLLLTMATTFKQTIASSLLNGESMGWGRLNNLHDAVIALTDQSHLVTHSCDICECLGKQITYEDVYC